MKGPIERKCRSCSTWSSFTKNDRADECVSCGKPYGKLVLGLDVQPKTKAKR